MQSYFARRPWLASLLLLGLVALFAVKLVRVEVRLYPRGPETAGLLVVGAVVLPALYLVAKRLFARHLVIAAVALVGGASVIVIGTYLGLGWGRHGPAADPATFPRSEQAFGAGVVLSFVVVLGAISVLVFWRSVFRPGGTVTSSRAGTTGKTHAVAVYDVRPDPGVPSITFDPYFIAMCDCGWVGETRPTSDEAFADARRHDPNVAAAMQRPVG